MKKQFDRKRIYGVCKNARFLSNMLLNIWDFGKAQKRGSVSKDFEKRIMLAVTQVNGCEMCSFYHTAEALKQGMGKEEIDALLGGEFEGVPERELPALLFAQHYAQTAARPEDEVRKSFLEVYGQQQAADIMCYIRAIMVGNAQGNIAGAFKSRLKGKPEEGSSLLKEISVLLGDIVLIPALLIISLILLPFRAIWIYSKREKKINMQ